MAPLKLCKGPVHEQETHSDVQGDVDGSLKRVSVRGKT